MSENKLVSVVIPVKNSDKTIEKTINSILNQSYKKIEIVVVDDGSTDDSLKIIKNIIKKNKSKVKIKCFENEKNLGPAATRNRGVKESKGEIIFFIDSDCFAPEKWLEKIMKEYSEKNIGGVGGYLEPGEKTFVAFLERMQNKYLLNIKNEKITGKEKCPAGYTNSMTYLKKALIETGGFDENFKFASGEDFELKKRVCEKGYNLVFIPEPIIHLEKYDLDYLVKRIITRGLNKKAPKDKSMRIIYAIFMMPIILFNIIVKIIKYKKEKLI